MKLISLLLAATLVSAQPKPNFSGTWKQDNAKSIFANLPAPISVTDMISHKEPSLHLTQTIVGPHGDSITSEHDFSTDGREQTGKSRNYTEKNAVQWEGHSLVFTNRRNYSGRDLVIREVWTLSEDGKLLTKERYTPDAKGELKQTFVLEKQ